MASLLLSYFRPLLRMSAFEGFTRKTDGVSHKVVFLLVPTCVNEFGLMDSGITFCKQNRWYTSGKDALQN